MKIAECETVAAQIKSRVEKAAMGYRVGASPAAVLVNPLEVAAAKRIAELSKVGHPATARVIWKIEKGMTFFSIEIRLPDGTFEVVSDTSIVFSDEGEEKQMDLPKADANESKKPDYVNHPPHYASHPSGVECVDIAEHLSFNLGNALKYIWRWQQKDDPEENLEKCLWYLEREDRFVKLHALVVVLNPIARTMVRKAIDTEGKSSPLGKFLLVLDQMPYNDLHGSELTSCTVLQGSELSETSERLLSQLMGVVRTVLREIKRARMPKAFEEPA